MDLTQKAALLTEDMIDTLRNKPVTSTLVERWKLIDAALTRYERLPQPLKLSYGIYYILENASLPMKPYDILLGRFDDHVPDEAEEAFVVNFRDTNRQQLLIDGGHITLDWPKLIAVGLDGYLAEAERGYENALTGGADGETLDFYYGYTVMLKAFKNYIKRYAAAAREAGLTDAADCCDSIAGPAPDSFRGGMQLVLFIETIYYIYAGAFNPTLTLGRLDDILLDLYSSDLASGKLTRADAGAIIDDFNGKCNLILGRGEHQMSGGSKIDTGWWRNNGYDDPTYVVIGGYSNRHPGVENPLTELFAERINPRYENPVYICRHTPKGSRNEKAWDIIYDKARKNGSILIYNDDTVIAALEHAGIEHSDAVEYTVHGCNWIDVPPRYCVIATAGGSLAEMLIRTLLDYSGDTVKERASFGSIEEIYSAFADTFRSTVHTPFENIRAFNRSTPPSPDHISMTELFTEGVLEKGRTMAYAVKYPAAYTLIRHIGTAADIIAAIEKLVFTDKLCSYDELIDAVCRDWSGSEALLAAALNAPKYGTDNSIADTHAVRIMKLCESIADEETINKDGVRDVYSLPLTITDMNHIGEGARLPASPDGRRKGAPLSENLSPTTGHAESVTALLNSVSKLPLDRICAGALNIRLTKASMAGDEGAERLKILGDTFFELGGMQLQISVTDTAELRDAQLHPENYKDLMVRITGYSAVFVDMCPFAQNEIIRRDELS